MNIEYVYMHMCVYSTVWSQLLILGEKDWLKKEGNIEESHVSICIDSQLLKKILYQELVRGLEKKTVGDNWRQITWREGSVT